MRPFPSRRDDDDSRGVQARNRRRAFVRTTTRGIANIVLSDAMIPSYDANLGRMEFSERTGGFWCGDENTASDLILSC
jgi:hypothetical protein